jgi:hypothetical protein
MTKASVSLSERRVTCPHLRAVYVPPLSLYNSFFTTYPNYFSLVMRLIALYCLVLFALLPLVVGQGHCRVNRTFTMVADTPAALAKRSAGSVISGEVLPWPRIRWGHGRWRRTVRYCYKNKTARDIIDCDLQEAITRWFHTIDHGSNLAFWEEKDGGNPVYCRAGGNTEWNYALDADTLEIEYDPTWEGQAASHVGYEDPTGKQGGYHWMIVGHFERWRDRADTLTHEVC